MPTQKTRKHTETFYSGVNDELCPLFSGYEYCLPLHSAKCIRDHYLLCCVLDGYGRFCPGSAKNYRETEEYRMGAGETFLIPPHQFAFYEADRHEPWTYAWIGFSGRMAGVYLQNTDFASRPVVKTGTGIYRSICDLTDMTAQIERPHAAYMYASAAIWTILADLIRSASLPGASGRMNRYVEQAVGVIRTNYMKDLTVSGIADRLGISREYFCKIFREGTGKSPSRYLLQFRIEKACALLRESEYPVYLIAQYTGFSDHTYFSRRFHELTGKSPLEYRRYARGF